MPEAALLKEVGGRGALGRNVGMAVLETPAGLLTWTAGKVVVLHSAVCLNVFTKV